MLEIHVKLLVPNGCLGMDVVTSAVVIKQIQMVVVLSVVGVLVIVVGVVPYAPMPVHLGHTVRTAN